MKSFLALGTLAFIGFAGWRIGGQLSADAIGMALGILFGVMAGIPTALMVLAGRRRDDRYEEERRMSRQRQLPQQQNSYGNQPPVIVVTGQGGPNYVPPQQQPGFGQSYGQPYDQTAIGALPAPRQFTVVGGDEDID